MTCRYQLTTQRWILWCRVRTRTCHPGPVTELVGNKATEDVAIAWVIQVELAAGRHPRDTRYQGAPADIESPPRLIEVKAFGKSTRGDDLLLESRQVEQARSNADFYGYVVENVRQGDPASSRFACSEAITYGACSPGQRNTGTTVFRGQLPTATDVA
jgi:Protein NO VEIN, C-terminal